ncbi:TetR/AcrR family transcriptional regulator [Granulosicoccus sp.]|nr:TetR/AcrR family transcriptional regulator [Granulosicoccus sp.]MDB4223407.1 TetR/AcrR family transcriptional regulator [Granulosicoccus sp.]
MKKPEDPRLAATRNIALDAALDILLEAGVLAVTYASVSKATGISRSTLYRHWPEIAQLRNNTFGRAATPSDIAPKTNGPLRADLTWILGILMDALNETPWGQVAPQVIAAAATDNEARTLINDFMKERISYVESVFAAAEARGELSPDAPVRDLVEMFIAVPYFRKFIAGLPLDQQWRNSHVELICRMAEAG